jgi:hypothetical protein
MKNLFFNIRSASELQHYLQTTENKVSFFICQKIKQPCQIGKISAQIHHIIPLHSGGCDEEWNKILLTYEDHTEIHRLMGEVFDSYYDKAVYLMRQNMSAEAQKMMVLANVQKMKTQKKGRFDSLLQSHHGKKNKAIQRKTYSRSLLMKKALENGTIWLHTNGTERVIATQSCKGPLDLANQLIIDCDSSMKESFEKKKNRSYFYNGLLKLILGSYNAKSNKRLYKVGPWKLQGIQLPVAMKTDEI